MSSKVKIVPSSLSEDIKTHEPSDNSGTGDIAIRVSNLSKCYQIYDSPRDRLKQFVMPRFQRLTLQPPKHYFREFWALKEVSFEVKKGETLGIIGKNGSGKSTLLQIICGTLYPSCGAVEINGRVAALLELGSGFNPEFTGRENVYMNASVLGLSREQVDEKFDDIADFADIGEFIEEPVKTYSSGMVVRLAFAVIAHVDADILIIDEALSVGDAFFVQKCMRFLRQFMEAGTVVFVSHDTGAVLNLCQRAILLQEGGIAGQGTPKEVTEHYLEKLYESQQGESVGQKNGNIHKVDGQEKPTRDMRLDFINQTNLRNDIELFPFSPDAPSFGTRGAKITGVQLLDNNNRPLSWIVGGLDVKLEVKFESSRKLHNVIVGFQIKDRLGQVIFGDNSFITYLEEDLEFEENSSMCAFFAFQMPILPNGDYSIMAAISEGTQEKHVILTWIYDALIFKVHSSMVCHGLIGVPMQSISVCYEH